MEFSFTCPIEGCGQKMFTEAVTRQEAVDNLTQTAKEHLSEVHPDLHKTDEQIREDINSLTVIEGGDEST